MCANFQAKRTTLSFLTQICPEMDFWLEILKTNVEISIDIPQIFSKMDLAIRIWKT